MSCVEDNCVFANKLLSRLLEPLAVIWIRLYLGNCHTCHHYCDLEGRFYEIVGDLVLGVRIIHKGAVNTVIRYEELERCGTLTGLWSLVMSPVLQYYMYKRSNEFIKRAATYAFLCMCTLTCKDIARVIAREVANMYQRDWTWIDKNVHTSLSFNDPTPEEMRKRILSSMVVHI